ncbi:MAG: tRNA (adenosine(37)-N6)-threonylcarbamoyltransferase complex ATPase subunit type 1 TsaE [Bacteroidia bacterium]
MQIKYSLGQISDVVKEISLRANDCKIWAFSGEMGTGKTTLIKALCNFLGVKNEISSPTFSLVNEYRTTGGKTIYHFDFYRIKNLEAVYDIGYEEYLSSGNLCLIEWPEKIEELLLHENVFRMGIAKVDEYTREIIFL